MKKLYILFFASLLAFNANSQVSFCEDFEALTVGDSIVQTSASWNSWDELMNGATAPFIDDAMINSFQASSGSKSLYFPPTAAAGPEDVVLMFDPTLNITQSNLSSLSTPYTTGSLIFSQMMHVRGGAGAYFNFQAENAPGVSWALEVNFTDNGTPDGDIIMSNTSGTSFAAEYPVNTWFEIKFDIDLSNNNWEVLIDGVSYGSFANSINQIASLDLYPRINDEFWVDDVCYSYDTTQIVLPNLDLAVLNIDAISGLDGQNRDVTVEVRNFGTDPIHFFDITFDYNGSQMTENLTNLNSGFGLLSLTSMQVDFPNSITLISGTNIGTATVSNVNGLLQDDNPSNDTSSIQITAITPTPGKLVIGEQATGTPCFGCPRGIVAANEMERDYNGYFQSISIHTGDPMESIDYYSGLSNYITGLPGPPTAGTIGVPATPGAQQGALVDRGTEIDPSDFHDDFFTSIVTPISATFTADANATGNVIDVQITTTVTSAINGDWKFACILIEDSVTGTGGTWYQANKYGDLGISLIDVDGTDWGVLPDWVPSTQMIYRHVSREILPSFEGGSLSSSSYDVGNQFVHNFQFTTDPTWDLNSMHVVGMLLNPNGMVDNAVSIPVNILTFLDNVTSDVKLTIYPNPAISTTTLLMTLDTEKEVSISVKSIEGKLIAKGEYGTMIGSNSLTFDVSDFANGVYIIEAIVGNEVIVKKFIKE